MNDYLNFGLESYKNFNYKVGDCANRRFSIDSSGK